MENRLWTRRQVLRATLAFGLVPGVSVAALGAAQGTSKGDFSFVVLNDLHYRDARCAVWFQRVLSSIRKLTPAPKFLVLNGDLSESGTRGQLGAVREMVGALPMRVYPIIGNHDCSEEGDRTEFEKAFGRRANYRFEYRSWQFLALDTIEGSKVYRTHISPQTLGWIERTASDLDPKRPIVVLTHFPLGRNWLRPVNAGKLLESLREQDLKAALGGHWHGATERKAGAAALSTSRCCSWWRENHDGSDQKGYLVCRVEAGQISHRFVAVEPPAGMGA